MRGYITVHKIFESGMTQAVCINIDHIVQFGGAKGKPAMLSIDGRQAQVQEDAFKIAEMIKEAQG